MTTVGTGSVLVRDALVFDGESPELIEGDVLVRDGWVVAVGEVSGSDWPLGEVPVIDADGAVVVPGLIDCHFHAWGVDLTPMTTEARPASWVTLAGARRLTAALRRGFTTVRDPAGGDIGLARAIEHGLLEAPHYLFTGPALSQTGGHGDMRDAELARVSCRCHTVEVVDGADNLRVAVRERLRTGAHAIKIMASGGVVSPTDPLEVIQYSHEEIVAVSEEATRRGSYVAAHAYSAEAVRHAVDGGVRSIEHGNLIDDVTAAHMAAHGAVLVPTLVTYRAMAERGRELGLPEVGLEKNAAVLDAGMRAVDRAMAAGVTVGFGTDLMGELESEQLRGLELQHEVQGMLELLRSATARNAKIIGDPTRGRLAPGCRGDLVVLDGNPFETPSCLWDPARRRTVVRRGAIAL